MILSYYRLHHLIHHLLHYLFHHCYPVFTMYFTLFSHLFFKPLSHFKLLECPSVNKLMHTFCINGAPASVKVITRAFGR